MLKPFSRQQQIFNDNKELKPFLVKRGMDFQQPFELVDIGMSGKPLKDVLKETSKSPYYVYVIYVSHGWHRKAVYKEITGYKRVKDIPTNDFSRSEYSSRCLFTSRAEMERKFLNQVKNSLYLLYTTSPLIPTICDDKETIINRVKRYASYRYNIYSLQPVYKEDKNLRITDKEVLNKILANTTGLLDKSGYLVVNYRSDLNTRLNMYKENKVNLVTLDYEPLQELLEQYKEFTALIGTNPTSEAVYNSRDIIKGIIEDVTSMCVLVKDKKKLGWNMIYSMNALNTKIKALKNNMNAVTGTIETQC